MAKRKEHKQNRRSHKSAASKRTAVSPFSQLKAECQRFIESVPDDDELAQQRSVVTMITYFERTSQLALQCELRENWTDAHLLLAAVCDDGSPNGPAWATELLPKLSTEDIVCIAAASTAYLAAGRTKKYRQKGDIDFAILHAVTLGMSIGRLLELPNIPKLEKYERWCKGQEKRAAQGASTKESLKALYFRYYNPPHMRFDPAAARAATDLRITKRHALRVLKGLGITGATPRGNNGI